MKIMTITIHSGGHGAYERQRRIARALMAAGHEVLWLSPGLDHPAGEIHLPVEAVRNVLPGFLGWIVRLRSAFRKYRRHLDQVDAIFTVREYDALACILDAHLRTVPHVFFMRGDTVACERYLARYALNPRARVRSAMTALTYPFIQGYVFRRLHRIVVVAQFMADAVSRRVRRPASLGVLPNDSEVRGLDIEIDPGQEDAIRALKVPGGFVVGLVGQIFYRAKGFDLFLSAMRRLKALTSVRAVVIGYGSEEDAVTRHIRSDGLTDQVVFLGRSAAAHRLMPLFDLVVVPTRFTDANPNVVLEALEAGCCILASDIEAHRAQLQYPELLFSNGNEIELAQRITELYTDADARARNRLLAGKRRDAFHFDWDSAVTKELEAAARGMTVSYQHSDEAGTR